MNSIKTTGKDIWNDEKPSSYPPYLIQRGLFSNDFILSTFLDKVRNFHKTTLSC